MAVARVPLPLRRRGAGPGFHGSRERVPCSSDVKTINISPGARAPQSDIPYGCSVKKLQDSSQAYYNGYFWAGKDESFANVMEGEKVFLLPVEVPPN